MAPSPACGGRLGWGAYAKVHVILNRQATRHAQLIVVNRPELTSLPPIVTFTVIHGGHGDASWQGLAGEPLWKPIYSLSSGSYAGASKFAIVATMVNDAIDLNGIRRVLVTKLRHHGDVLLTSPVFQVLKNHAPHLEIDALVYADTTPMLALHPAISEIFTIDRNWKKQGGLAQIQNEWQLFSALKARRYDLIVHLTEHPRGGWLKQMLGIRYGVAAELGSHQRWGWKSFSHHYSRAGSQRHTVETNLDALRRIGIQPELAERRLVLEPGDAAREKIRALLNEHHLNVKGFIHLHPTSRWLFKTWPEQKVAELIRQLEHDGHRVVMTSAPDAGELAMVKRTRAAGGDAAVDLSGQLSLKELAALTAQAKLFVGVDSAPMHIAAAMQTPVVALFGPSGDVEWGPWMVNHRIVTSAHPCRPCGQDGCGGGKVSECLTTLPMTQVLAAVETLLAQ